MVVVAGMFFAPLLSLAGFLFMLLALVLRFALWPYYFVPRMPGTGVSVAISGRGSQYATTDVTLRHTVTHSSVSTPDASVSRSSDVPVGPLLLAAVLLAAFPVGYAALRLPPSTLCSPYRGGDSLWAAVPAAIGQWPSGPRTLVFYLGTESFVMPLLISLGCVVFCVFCCCCCCYFLFFPFFFFSSIYPTDLFSGLNKQPGGNVPVLAVGGAGAGRARAAPGGDPPGL
jgi:hypothetical protein